MFNKKGYTNEEEKEEVPKRKRSFKEERFFWYLIGGFVGHAISFVLMPSLRTLDFVFGSAFAMSSLCLIYSKSRKN